MISFFYYIYNIFNHQKIKNNFYFLLLLRTFRKSIYLTYNLVIPLYLNIFFRNKESLMIDPDSDFYICLTSFPARINKLHLVIKSLFLQKKKPISINLYLSRKQFDNEQCLPNDLLSLKKLGLCIILVDDDIRSYKKYFYAKDLNKSFSIVIVDDDIFYPNYITQLLTTNREPGCIVANRCVKINNNKPYKKWVLSNSGIVKSKSHMPTGCGGVLYPPESLPDLAFDVEQFSLLAPNADDIWLYTCVFLNGYTIKHTGFNRLLLDIHISNDVKLNSTNVTNNNDFVIENIKNKFNTSNIFK